MESNQSLSDIHIQQVYIAYLARPADPGGLNYWLEQSIITLPRELADCIYGQAEYQDSLISQLPVQDQIDQLYLNLFGRHADLEGLNYWTSQVEKGVYSLSNLVFDLLAAVESPIQGNEELAGKDALSTSNKVTAANSFTQEVPLSKHGIHVYVD